MKNSNFRSKFSLKIFAQNFRSKFSLKIFAQNFRSKFSQSQRFCVWLFSTLMPKRVATIHPI